MRFHSLGITEQIALQQGESPVRESIILHKTRRRPRDNPLAIHVGEQVRVTGDLETYKKKSVIKVTRPTQVKILEPTKATKKKKATAE